MTSWRKHYVVKDKKKKSKKFSSNSTSKPKKKKTWKGWLYFSLICLLLGLAAGFQEDGEFESFLSDLSSATASGNTAYGTPGQTIWKKCVNNYRPYYTDHFLCRMECRDITRKEVWQALRNGVSVHENVDERRNYRLTADDVRIKVEGESRNGKPLTVVFAYNMESRELMFITTWNREVSKYDDPCSDNCKGRPRN